MLAEYTKTMKIDKEPAFFWWVPHTLRKKSCFLSKVKALLHKNNLKFGIKVPRNIKHALLLDKTNGDYAWRNVISKEMSNVKVAFKFIPKDRPHPVGYKQIRCHLIFDVKIDLTHKARFVAGGHMTDQPTAMTYASVVSRESVRAPTQEKFYYWSSLEWGDDMEGSICVIVRAL